MVPPPMLNHQHVSKELQFTLTAFIKQGGLGELYNAPVALVLDEINYTEPDLIFVSEARRAILTERGIEGAPDLVVEIHSPSTRHRDLDIKRQMYERREIPHYWLVDPQQETLVALELTEGTYRTVASLGARDCFEPSLFPGLTIELGSLWRRP